MSARHPTARGSAPQPSRDSVRELEESIRQRQLTEGYAPPPNGQPYGDAWEGEDAPPDPPGYQPYPLAALPDPVRGYVDAGARAIGVDPAYVALPLLAVMAGAWPVGFRRASTAVPRPGALLRAKTSALRRMAPSPVPAVPLVE